MNCQRAREFFSELLDPRTPGAAPDGTPAGLAEARDHLAHCPECQREFSALSQTLAALDALPTAPASPHLRRNFYAMLEEEKRSARVSTTACRAARPGRAAFWRWILSPLAGCALVAAGFVAGLRHAPAPTPQAVVADSQTRRELQELRSKVDRMESMSQLVAASLQQQRPANDRLRTIMTSATQENPSDRILTELIASLALDSSANVRLRALDALYPHSGQEVVRAGVLASLTRESSPLVQVAMIDFLAAARDNEARPALEKMSVSEAVDRNVREAAKRALAQL